MPALLPASAGAAAIAAGLTSATSDWLLLGGAIALVGTIVHQVLVPLARAIHKAAALLELLEQLHDWMNTVDRRLTDLEATAAETESSAKAVARKVGATPRSGATTRRPRPRPTPT